MLFAGLMRYWCAIDALLMRYWCVIGVLLVCYDSLREIVVSMEYFM
ncbi:MAG: hypothetical protein WCQ70_01840 [Lentimicrobiaceae bacterium]